MTSTNAPAVLASFFIQFLVRRAALLLTIIFGVTLTQAQTQPNLENGFKHYGSYDFHGLDTVNVMNLASAINADIWAGVKATPSAGTINFTSVAAAIAANYSLSAGFTYDSNDFPHPSFTTSATGMSGGTDGPPVFGGHAYTTFYSYDALGDLIQVMQKGGTTDQSKWRVRTSTYDSLARLLTASNPESGLISYFYDNVGNVLQKVMPSPNQMGSAQHTVSYCYDALNRLNGKAYSWQNSQNGQLPAGTAVVSYSYDQGSSGIGHLTGLTDQAGSASYSYDSLGRMASEQRTIGTVSKSMGYSYNLDGSVKTLTYPSNAVITYMPDVAGRMLSAVDSANNINYVIGASYGPDNALTGFISGQSSGFAGITNAFSYNKRLQPANMSASSPVQTVFSIGYDFHLGNGDNGNVYGITNYKDNNRNQTFTYDGLNRLASAQNAGTDCSVHLPDGHTEYWGNSYAYDAWGNLLQKNVTKCSAENMTVTADAHNWIHTGAAPDYGYDAAGNMTSDPTDGVSMTYDAENRIATATKSGVATTYTYDADGNRVKKTSGTSSTLYWYMAPGIVAESDLSGTVKSEYLFFNGERVARKDFPSNAVSYYFSDHLKTASVITDSAGHITDDSDFYPFGGELQFTNSGTNHYKYGGHEQDIESGLYNYGARHYSPSLSRFMTPDWAANPATVPFADFGNPQSLNLYTYGKNNPTTFSDPDGHDPLLATSIDVNTQVFVGLAKSFVHWLTSGSPPHIMTPGPSACVCPAPQQNNSNDKNDNKNNNKNNNNSNQQSTNQQSGSNPGKSGKSGTQPQQPTETEGNDLGRSSTTKQTGTQGQNTETTVSDPAGSTTYKTTPGKTGGQATYIVRKDAAGNTVYVKQEARTNNQDFTKAPDHVHYYRPQNKEVH